MSFFQSAEFYELMSGLPGLEPFYINYSKQESRIWKPILGVWYGNGRSIKRYFSSRILIIGEPENYHSDNAISIDINDWKYAKPINRSSIYTELRLLEPSVSFNGELFPENVIYKPNVNILIDTTIPVDSLFSNLASVKKRQVNSSIKSGAYVRKALTEQEVMSFYQILKGLYKTKIRKPLLPLEVFIRVFNNKNAGEIFLVIFENKIIGGMLCPVYHKQEIYEWYIAGLDAEMKQKKVYPSVLVTWEVIKYATANGIARFNFMGAGEKDKPYGVRDFKMQFGGRLVDAPRYIIVHKPILYFLGKLAIRFRLGG